MPVKQKLFVSIAVLLFAVTVSSFLKFGKPVKPAVKTLPAGLHTPSGGGNKTARKIQVAILLDVSNSMDGLIEQAKAQLWNMLSVLGKTNCNGQTPRIEIALYEYGRSSNNPGQGYVKRINPFLTDLDQVSRNLFSLTTNGGDEYCGQVMYTSLQDLCWDPSTENYKVIFIAGNEDFLQGMLPFTKACAAAKQKNVIVNTIFCGDRMQGIREHWNLGAECGNGSFTSINADAQVEDIQSPYDDALFRLNDKLNATYVSYGQKGEESKQKQAEMDVANYGLSKSVAAKRVAVKSRKEVYRNESWDLVDAEASTPGFVEKIPPKELPASLQNKSKEERSQYIKKLAAEREQIQKEIAAQSKLRETYIQKAREKNQNNTLQTLETEIEKIIRQQAGRYKMVIR